MIGPVYGRLSQAFTNNKPWRFLVGASMGLMLAVVSANHSGGGSSPQGAQPTGTTQQAGPNQAAAPAAGNTPAPAGGPQPAAQPAGRPATASSTPQATTGQAPQTVSAPPPVLSFPTTPTSAPTRRSGAVMEGGDGPSIR